MRYYPAKGALIIILICCLSPLFALGFSDKEYFAATLIFLSIAYLVWMWFDTYYTIADGKLSYRSALIKGTINIDTISEIVKNRYLYSGIKASLSLKGLIIKYNRWDDVFISPENADQFIAKLTDINPGIKITG